MGARLVVAAMNALVWGVVGALAGAVAFSVTSRHRWTEGAGLMLGLAGVGALSAVAGVAARPGAFALLIGLLLPATVVDPRVRPLGVGLGAIAGALLVFASDTLLTIAVFVSIGSVAVWTLWSRQPMNSTSNE